MTNKASQNQISKKAIAYRAKHSDNIVMKYTNVQLKTMRRYVGERIAEVRKKRSPAWTQFDLAMASGCRPEAISRVERGASDFGISYVFRIAAALEVNPADLMPYPGAHPSPDGSSLHSDMTVHET